MTDQKELESIVKERLEEIRQVPPRNPHMASRGRAHFLGRAVSAQLLQRQKGWKSIFRKEQYAMNVLLSILVIAGMLFGGGATVRAAQDDLPSEPLYELKIWSEDLGLQLQTHPDQQVDRLMELAQIRVQEMAQLVESGAPIPDQVRLRLERHIQEALQICADMDDPALNQTLLRIRDRLQEQDRDMERLQLHSQDQAQFLTQTRMMLHERLQLVEAGLLNREVFRQGVRNGFRLGQDVETVPPFSNGSGQQYGQPTIVPGGPNLDAGEPNTDPGGPNTNPGGPNSDPGGPNSDAGGTNSQVGPGPSSSGNSDAENGTGGGGGSGPSGNGQNRP